MSTTETKKTKNSLITKLMIAEPWPRINGEPNTKFEPNGVWELKARCVEAEHADELIDIIEKARDEFVEYWKRHNNGKKARLAPLPISHDEETEEVIFKFKAKAKFKNGVSFTPPCFDSKKNTIAKDIKIYGGTTLRVKFKPYCWYVPTMGIGVSLQLQATSIFNLVSEPTEASQNDFDDNDEFGEGFVLAHNGKGIHDDGGEEAEEEEEF